MIDHHNENVTFKMEITKKFTEALTKQSNEIGGCGYEQKKRLTQPVTT